MEFGTHDELMALNGRYKYLYGLQTDALADDVTVVSGDSTPASVGLMTPTPILVEKTGVSVEVNSIDEKDNEDNGGITNGLGVQVDHDSIAIPAA